MEPLKPQLGIEPSPEGQWIDRDELYERFADRLEDDIEPAEKLKNLYGAAQKYITTVRTKSEEAARKQAAWSSDESQLTIFQKTNQRTAEAYTALADIFLSEHPNELQLQVAEGLRAEAHTQASIFSDYTTKPLHGTNHALQSLFIAQTPSMENIAHLVKNFEYDGNGREHPNNREEIMARALCFMLLRSNASHNFEARTLAQAIENMSRTNNIVKCKAIERILLEAAQKPADKKSPYLGVFETALRTYVRGYLFYKTLNGGQFLEQFMTKAKYFASIALTEVFNGSPRPEGDLDALITPDYLATIGLDARAVMLLHQSRADCEKICADVKRHLLGILE